MGKRKERASVSEPVASLQRKWSSYTWPLAFLLVAVGSIYLYRLTVEREHKWATPPPLVVHREDLADRSYREVAELRKPLILTGTVADKWLARKSFTASYLTEKLPHVMAHRQENKRSFITFHDDKPLESLASERWEDFNVKVNVTIPELLLWHEDNRNPSTGPYLYFSQDIATLKADFPEIMGHVQPLDDLILSQDNVQVNLWIGRAGIITHTHYDCTFNFFVQLQGRKRFTLFPPDSTMYLYPCLHPHYGHSQVDILNPDLSTFPQYTDEGSWVAEVEPGDMLVVPPFWFHHVETLEQSVSVNVWSDAPEYALLNQIYEQPIPFEESWSWSELATATRVYIYMLLQSLSISKSQIFMTHLLTQRYEPVVMSGNLTVSESANERVWSFCSSVDWEKEKFRLTPILGRGINLLEPLFALITTRITREVCVGNYIEHLLHLVLGLENIYPFLKNCFNDETSHSTNVS